MTVEEKGRIKLCCAIINQAIDDWRMLIENNQRVITKKFNVIIFAELRKFFKSAWCDQLMDVFDFDGKYILKMLEKELELAERSCNFNQKSEYSENS